MRFIKKNNRFIIFILILLLGFFAFNIFYYDFDATWEYGFCHALRMGEIPYKDFNIISTPLFIFLFSIGLFINDSFIVFLIEAIIINIIMFYFIDKVYAEKSLIYIVCVCFTLFFSFIPTYNFLCFVLIVLLICFEKLHYSDKVIGFFLGLLILSKHTIGLPIVCLVFIGLFIKRHGIKGIINRFIFMLIPLSFLFIYLIFTGALFNFLDLTIFGLFDFASNNTSVDIFFFYSLGLFVLSIIYFFKNKFNIISYYIVGSVMFVIPGFDKFHFCFYFIIFMFIVMDININIKNISLIKCCYILIIVFTVGVFGVQSNRYSTYSISNMSHYKYILMNKNFQKSIDLLNTEFSKYDNYYLFDGLGMFYDIVYDRRITYYDVPLYGNFGYDGSNKIIEMINNEKNCYFIVSDDDYHLSNISQLDLKTINYIKNNLKKVDSIYSFSVYYKE